MNKTTLRLADEIHPKQGHYFMNVVFHGVVGIGPIGYRPARNDLTLLNACRIAIRDWFPLALRFENYIETNAQLIWFRFYIDSMSILYIRGRPGVAMSISYLKAIPI